MEGLPHRLMLLRRYTRSINSQILFFFLSLHFPRWHSGKRRRGRRRRGGRDDEEDEVQGDWEDGEEEDRGDHHEVAGDEELKKRVTECRFRTVLVTSTSLDRSF